MKIYIILAFTVFSSLAFSARDRVKLTTPQALQQISCRAFDSGATRGQAKCAVVMTQLQVNSNIAFDETTSCPQFGESSLNNGPAFSE